MQQKCNATLAMHGCLTDNPKRKAVLYVATHNSRHVMHIKLLLLAILSSVATRAIMTAKKLMLAGVVDKAEIYLDCCRPKKPHGPPIPLLKS